jgi:hypothetical protein
MVVTPLPAIVLLPTPPLALETAITFLTFLILVFSGKPLCMRGNCGGAPARGSPYNLQSVLIKAFGWTLLTRGFSCLNILDVENGRVRCMLDVLIPLIERRLVEENRGVRRLSRLQNFGFMLVNNSTSEPLNRLN